MDFEQILTSAKHLVDEGSLAYQRLQEGAKVLGKRQLEALKVEAREKLVGGLMELALRVAAGKLGNG